MAATPDCLRFSDHAIARMVERGVTAEAVALALRVGRRRRAGGNIEVLIGHQHATQEVRLRDFVGLVVVYDECEGVIVTVKWRNVSPPRIKQVRPKYVYHRKSGSWLDLNRIRKRRPA